MTENVVGTISLDIRMEEPGYVSALAMVSPTISKILIQNGLTIVTSVRVIVQGEITCLEYSSIPSIGFTLTFQRQGETICLKRGMGRDDQFYTSDDCPGIFNELEKIVNAIKLHETPYIKQ